MKESHAAHGLGLAIFAVLLTVSVVGLGSHLRGDITEALAASGKVHQTNDKKASLSFLDNSEVPKDASSTSKPFRAVP
jgi:hypothetical protein